MQCEDIRPNADQKFSPDIASESSTLRRL